MSDHMFGTNGIATLFLISFTWAAFCPPIALAAPSASDIYGPKHSVLAPSNTTNDTTPIRLQVGDYDYEIPANYFDEKPNPMCNALGILLFALLPDFEGRSDKNLEEFQQVGQYRRVIHMRISNTRSEKNVEEVLKIHLDISLKNSTGMNKASSYSYLGLVTYLPENPDKHIVFVNSQDGHLLSYIRCNMIGSVPSPQCKHVFTMNDAIINFSYPFNRIGDWQKYDPRFGYFCKPFAFNELQWS